LVRERVPRLRRPYANAPIFAHWVPPDDFDLALDINNGQAQISADDEEHGNLEQRRILKDITWRNYLAAFALLAMVMVLQVLLTDLPFTRYSDPTAMTQAVVADVAQPIGRASFISTILGPQLELSLQVDDQVIFSDIYDTVGLLEAKSTPFYYEYELATGLHQMRLTLEDASTDITFILVDEPVNLKAGQIFRYGH